MLCKTNELCPVSLCTLQMCSIFTELSLKCEVMIQTDVHRIKHREKCVSLKVTKHKTSVAFLTHQHDRTRVVRRTHTVLVTTV